MKSGFMASVKRVFRRNCYRYSGQFRQIGVGHEAFEGVVFIQFWWGEIFFKYGKRKARS